jgi:protein AaeX
MGLSVSTMPHEIEIGGAYVPAVIIAFVFGAFVTWMIDRLLAAAGFYQFVWHPSLFRVSLLVCIACALSLSIYR